MRIRVLLAASLLLGCAGSPEPAAAPPATASPAPSPPPAAAPAALDLSTPQNARTTIYEVLRRGDKEAFRRCVTRRILERHKDHFDDWYGIWKAAADKGAEPFKKIVVAPEDGQQKLDEN